MIPFWIIGIFIIATGAVAIQWNLLIGLIVVVAGAVTIILYVVVAPKYPVKALVFVKRRGNMRLMSDKASRVETDKNSGTYKYKFKALKGETKAAFYENLYPTRKGEMALFYSPAPGEFYQAIFNDEAKTKTIEYMDGEIKKTKEIQEASIEPVPDELLEWMILKQQRMKQKYMNQSIWDKFYPIIVVAVLAICMVIIINSTFQSMEPVVDGFRTAANKLSTTTEKLAEVAEKLALADKSGGTVTPIPKPPDVK